MDSTKRCHRCGELKSLDDFHLFRKHQGWAPKDGRQPFCKPCRREQRGSSGPDKTHADPVTRFWRHVQKSDDGCWVWTGCKGRGGYGTFRPGKSGDSSPGAHRFSWILHFGEIPDGLLVCHHCDNPPCVRPDHLFLGTYADNTHDRYAKGRAPLGDAHPYTKFAGEQVVEARMLRAEGWTISALGRRYNISRGSIRRALADPNRGITS